MVPALAEAMSPTMPSMSVDAKSAEHVALSRLPDEELRPLRRADGARGDAVRTSLEVFERRTHGYVSPDCSVRFWNGSIWMPGGHHPPRFSIALHHPGALRRMFLHRSQVALGEAYLAGDFSVEGDLESSFRLADYLSAPPI